MTDAAAPHPGYGAKSYRAYVLGVLVVIYTFNFIDRILVGIIQGKIKEDIDVSLFELGLLGGPAFAVLYTLLGVPIARYAERSNRINIVAIGAALWSIATTACGFAQTYLQLVLARIFVGIGEAACIPPSHSAISDYFPAERRASALGIFALGIPLGTMLAAVGGGWVAQNLDWRAAFWMLGAPGVLAALILKLTVKEPPRASVAPTPSLGAAVKALAAKHSFWHMAMGGALIAMVGYSSAQYLVLYVMSAYGLSLTQASYAFGAIAGVAVAGGTFLGGYLSDRLAARRPLVLSQISALGVLVAVPAYFLAFAQPSFWPAFAILMVAPVFHYLYLGPMFAVTQGVAEPRMRATAAALLLLIVNLIGYGLGPPFVGAVADYFSGEKLAELGVALQACEARPLPAACVAAEAHGLKLGLMLSLVFMAWAGVHFLLAGRTLLKDRAG
jgi:predicted MFS family arabinose efflux permease